MATGLAAAVQKQWDIDGCVAPLNLKLNAPIIVCKDNINDKGTNMIAKALVNGTSISILQFLSRGTLIFSSPDAVHNLKTLGAGHRAIKALQLIFWIYTS